MDYFLRATSIYITCSSPFSFGKDFSFLQKVLNPSLRFEGQNPQLGLWKLWQTLPLPFVMCQKEHDRYVGYLVLLHSDSWHLEWDYQKDSGLIPMDQDHSSRAHPFVGLLLLDVVFHTAGRSCWDKFMSLLCQQLSNGAVACFVEENAKAHISFKYTFIKYMPTVSNTCSDCAMVKEICPRKAKFRTVSCLRTLSCL